MNTHLLAGTTQGRFRVLATDGLNTSVAETSGLFTISDKPPRAQIVYPEDSTVYSSNLPVHVIGTAYDREDGQLTGDDLRWTSTLDGDLGRGSQVSATLSPGQHTITLTATDSDGNQGTDTISLFTGHRSYMPLVRIE